MSAFKIRATSISYKFPEDCPYKNIQIIIFLFRNMLTNQNLVKPGPDEY